MNNWNNWNGYPNGNGNMQGQMNMPNGVYSEGQPVKQRKPKKSDIEQYLLMSCNAMPGAKVQRISEGGRNGKIRHSCVATGVGVYPMTRTNVWGYTIDFCYYKCCNKLVYYIDEI